MTKRFVVLFLLGFIAAPAVADTDKETRQRCTAKGSAAARACYAECGRPTTPEGNACRKECWENTYRPVSKSCGYDPGPWLQ